MTLVYYDNTYPKDQLVKLHQTLSEKLVKNKNNTICYCSPNSTCDNYKESKDINKEIHFYESLEHLPDDYRVYLDWINTKRQ